MVPGREMASAGGMVRQVHGTPLSLIQLSDQQISQAASEIHNYPIWKGVWGTGLVAEWDSQESRDRNSGSETL